MLLALAASRALRMLSPSSLYVPASLLYRLYHDACDVMTCFADVMFNSRKLPNLV